MNKLRTLFFLEAVLNLSPKAHTKTDTSSQEKLFGEIQNSFSVLPIIYMYNRKIRGLDDKKL